MAMDREREENGTVTVEGGGPTERAESNDSGHVQEIFRVIESIAQLGDYRRSHRKECCALARRINLLLPLLEEVRDIECGGGPIPEEGIFFLQSLKDALLSAAKLLKTCNEGSKIYLVVETESVMTRFQRVNEALSKSLKGVPYDELGISVEVEEQIVQLKRAKRRTDTQDMEFAMDMMVVFSEENGQNADRASVERLAKKLELHTFEDLENETLAIRNLTTERGGRDMESTQKITDLLNKFRQIFGMGVVDVLHNPVMPKTLAKRPSLIIPHEFLCPITLAIMTDPVIVASGQTYERESIEKWFDSNHRTCPKTRQTLAHLSLAPNYALKNLILQWCEQNNYQLPKKDVPAGSESFCSENSEAVSALVRDLSSSALEVQRKAVKKIRILSKENQDCRTSIANSGGIPPLVQLLSYPDSKIQENAVTSLLNLSLNETNKKLIAQEGAIPAIIEVLQSGSTEARENSAATLFSLSMVDENKVAVGLSNGIPPLVELLQKGTIRGKKDAAYALFNLCLNHANKGAAIEAGIVPPLLKLLKDEQVGMVDEALSIFLLLASHPEGRNAIGQLSFVETLVSFIGQGTPKNKECATSVLIELCSKNPNLLLAALQFGVYEHLIEITRNGTDRAKRKANALLDLMSKSEQI